MGKSTQELKYKRLKVGHACFICRSKKIKCDGLRPCMQCKARGRQCQSSSNLDLPAEMTAGTPESQASDSSVNESDDESILFSRSIETPRRFKSSMRNESWTNNIIQRAAQEFKKNKNKQAFPGYATFGSFVKWIQEPPLPAHYTYPIEMPSSDMQMLMLNNFFNTRYSITPVIPKKYFFNQLKVKGPLITPLLLNAIYCAVSARCPELNLPKSAIFFDRARRLVDDFLDVPRISTVVALGILSLYEPEPVKGKIIDQHCRSWIFSGMCFRMCLELGLNLDSEFVRKSMSAEEVELRRRVFWFCYCLDKLQSIEWERPWILPASLAKVSLPQALPDDDDDERSHVQFLKDKINISLLAEEGIQIRAMFSINGGSDTASFYQQLENYTDKILTWKKGINQYPGSEECSTVEQVMSLASESPHIAHLFTIYYFVLTDTLFCLPESPMRILEHRIYASQLIRCVRNLCEYPAMVIRYEFLAHSVVCALRVHARYIDHPDPVISQQSYYYLKECITLLDKFQNIAVIPECSAILQYIPTLYPTHYQPDEFYDSFSSKQCEANPFLETPNSALTVPNLMMSSNYTNLETGFPNDQVIDFGDRHLWEQTIQQPSYWTSTPSSDFTFQQTYSPYSDLNYPNPFENTSIPTRPMRHPQTAYYPN